jgi:predicted enzyme related to lactoylglutathione lyase
MSDATVKDTRFQEATEYPHGAFSWADLATTDPAAAKQFYTALFGWTFEDTPAGGGQIYTMFFLNGKPVAGLMGIGPEQQAAGVEPHWASYVTVDDVDATTGKVAPLNGVVIAPPFDVLDSGRMSVIRDPTGATVSLWQAGTHAGSAYLYGPGVPNWHELYTDDLVAATEFYPGLLGWTAAIGENQGILHAGVHNGEQPIAVFMPREWLLESAPDLKPSWLLYFGVEDVPACAVHVQEMGGTVLRGPTEFAGTPYALLRDPQGAIFFVAGPPTA